MVNLEDVKIGDEIFWYDDFQTICSGVVQSFKYTEYLPSICQGVQLEKSFLN